jgi:two-component system, NarL family, nitrate/nitrite response regulator NarL
VRVLIIDDDRLFADVIRGALERVGLEVAAVAHTGRDGLTRVREHHPDGVVLDIGLPDQDGFVVGRRILEESPTTKVVILSTFDDPRRIDEAAALGFTGYLTKDLDVSQFQLAIGRAFAGKTARSGGRPPRGRAPILHSELTPREYEVLTLLVEGAGATSIAERLGISRNTVRTHVQSILTKLQVHSRLEAATFALRHDLVAPGRRPSSLAG